MIKRKHLSCYWPFVRGIHRWAVDSHHKDQRRRALMFSLISTRTSDWANNQDASDLWCDHAHYDFTVMSICIIVRIYKIYNAYPPCMDMVQFKDELVNVFPKISLWCYLLLLSYTGDSQIKSCERIFFFLSINICRYICVGGLGAVSIRKTVLPGMAIPMLKIRRPNGRLIFNMEIVIRR